MIEKLEIKKATEKDVDFIIESIIAAEIKYFKGKRNFKTNFTL